MAKLYFRYGAMGSSKTANAIMVWYNYHERCKRALLIKPGVDTRDGVYTIRSRSGLEANCILFDQIDWDKVRAGEYDCLIIDEAPPAVHDLRPQRAHRSPTSSQLRPPRRGRSGRAPRRTSRRTTTRRGRHRRVRRASG